MSGPKYLSDPQYDTEFWFNATLYTAYEWHRDFDTEAETREAFDAWLNSIRAEAWNEGEQAGMRRADWEYGATANFPKPNPYRKEAG